MKRLVFIIMLGIGLTSVANAHYNGYNHSHTELTGELEVTVQERNNPLQDLNTLGEAAGASIDNSLQREHEANMLAAQQQAAKQVADIQAHQSRENAALISELQAMRNKNNTQKDPAPQPFFSDAIGIGLIIALIGCTLILVLMRTNKPR